MSVQTIIASRCRICRREFEVELGPESYQAGKYLLSDHLLNEHTHREVVLVYADIKPWWAVARDRLSEAEAREDASG